MGMMGIELKDGLCRCGCHDEVRGQFVKHIMACCQPCSRCGQGIRHGLHKVHAVLCKVKCTTCGGLGEVLRQACESGERGGVRPCPTCRP